VALSIVFPPDDPDLSGELRSLRRLLGDEVMIIVGGRAAGGYRAVIEEIGALWLPDAPGLRSIPDILPAFDSSGGRR
jgi:hypothetical protein